MGSRTEELCGGLLKPLVLPVVENYVVAFLTNTTVWALVRSQRAVEIRENKELWLACFCCCSLSTVCSSSASC
eukprot:SAG31_NODE_33_length_32018_cov_69.763088_12_plen_73_part_00